MKPRIGIIGASGFVGSTLTEYLFNKGKFEIIPMIHSPGNAWRITRLGLTPKLINLLDTEAISTCLKDCTHIVNCSRGDKNVMLQGLKNLLKVSQKLYVEKFIHISSTSIFEGNNYTSPLSINEESEKNPIKGSYGWIKLEQDKLVKKSETSQFSVIILCPPNIIGPYSPFLLNLLEKMKFNKYFLLNKGGSPCPTVDIMNLIFAIELALIKKTNRNFFIITDDESPTWRELTNELLMLLNEEYNIPNLFINNHNFLNKKKEKASISNSIKHLCSSDARAFLRKDPLLKKIDIFIRNLISLLGPTIENHLRYLIEGPYKPPQKKVQYDLYLYNQQRKNMIFSNELAKKELNYSPLYSFKQSMKIFNKWYLYTHGCHLPIKDLLVQCPDYQC